MDGAGVDDLQSVVDHLVRRSVWIVGGDGWAYDIGSGGLDHVLASGRDVNVLVLDTEVYSNTGGQMSKATRSARSRSSPPPARPCPRADLALQAIAYGSVYVARVAMGADPQQTLDAFREAEAYDGPSLVLAYSHCIAHGIEMRNGLDQQYRAVASGYWPLIRYDPLLRPRAAIRSCSTRRGHASRSRSTRTGSCAIARSRTPIRRRPNGCTGSPSRRWISAGTCTRRWRPAARSGSPPTRAGSPMNLSTRYMGLTLPNPLVASASPLSQTVDGVRRLADAGVGAVVLYSLFEEQLRREAAENARLVDAGTESFAESLSISRPSPRRRPVHGAT